MAAQDWLDGGLIVARPTMSRPGKPLIAPSSADDLADAYEIVSEAGKFRLKLKDAATIQLGQHPQLFDTAAEAGAMRDQLMAWGAFERLIVVEHLLLRPKFPGDALYPAAATAAAAHAVTRTRIRSD